MIPAALIPLFAATQGVAVAPEAAPPATEAAPAVTPSREVELTWPEGVKLSLDASTYEAVVEYDKPIDEAAIKQFADRAGSQIADLRWNDTTLVVRAAPGLRLDTRQAANTVRFTFVPEAAAVAADVAPPAAAEDDNLELAIVRAQADAAAGYPGRARERLAELAAAHPDDKRLARLLADSQAATGNLASAAQGYSALGADDLYSRQVRAQAGGSISAGLIVRDNDYFSQTEFDGLAAVRVSPILLAGLGIRQFHNEAALISAPSGALADVTSDTTMADVLATIDIGRYTRADFRLSAQIDSDIVGGRVLLTTGSSELQGRATLAYHMPDVITPEQAILKGYTSKAAVGGSFRPTSAVFIQGDIGFNGYGLQDDGTVTETIFASGSAEFLVRRAQPRISLVYQFDGEYVQDIDVRPTGLAYIPFTDRENHTGQIAASLSLGVVQLTGAGGWTIDRLGDSNGPTASLSAGALFGRAWRAEASVGFSSISSPGAPAGETLYARATLTRYLGS